MELRFGSQRDKRQETGGRHFRKLKEDFFHCEMVRIQLDEAVFEGSSKLLRVRLASGKGGRNLPREKCGDSYRYKFQILKSSKLDL